jgi:hypothetical protein
MWRRVLLRVHGTLLTFVALLSATATTLGRVSGTGPFGFIRQDPMVWVGLMQAYLLMAIIAVLLVLGSFETSTRKWHVVGALAHVPPLVVALTSLAVFRALGAGDLIWIPIAFHLTFLVLESFAAIE